MAEVPLPANLTEAFEYLDELRESGDTNMFGARPYLQREFPRYSDDTARSVLKAWMDSFDGETSAAERVAKANKDPLP